MRSGVLAGASLLVMAAGAPADVAFDNFGAGDTFTGNGWLVQGPLLPPNWTHAFRFVPTVSGQVTVLTVAMEHLQGTSNGYIFDVRADSGGQPGGSVGVLGQVAGFTSGSSPVQLTAAPGVTIAAGTTYWLYAQGTGDADGTWRSSPTPGGVRAYSFDQGATWTVSVIDPPGGIGAFRIEVSPGGGTCYANCDGSTSAPVLNVADFTCFLQKFSLGDPYANCDGSTGSPVLNVADFTCFLQKYAQGCP